MIEIKEKDKCCGCHACYNACPVNAIEMIEDEKGFKYPKINKEKCINCGLCEKVCPIMNNKTIENQPKAYSCYNNDEGIRKESSSGGIFTLLAEKIIEKNGVVFGAMFDEEFNVKHGYVEKINELSKFRGSKYVQSSIGDMYKKAKDFLDEDKYVLFTGTPCQIEGLKSYLRKEYDKLYTQDIICHGVPSPLVWKKYLEYRKEKDESNPKNISFRNKDKGWKTFYLKFMYREKYYKKNQNEDSFMRLFLSNVILRDSCYNCSFKKLNRVSDITLADFWGIQNVDSSMDDDKGTSLVIVNSAKGKELFEKISNKITKKEQKLEEAIKYNPSMISSVKMANTREDFFKNVENFDFDKDINKYIPKVSLFRKILSKLKRVVKKIINKT